MLTPCLHEWTHIATVHRGEVDIRDPLAHTQVELFACTICRTVDAFPPQNAALLTERYVTALRAQLAAGGWQLPAGITWFASRVD